MLFRESRASTTLAQPPRQEVRGSFTPAKTEVGKPAHTAIHFPFPSPFRIEDSSVLLTHLIGKLLTDWI